MRAISSLPKRKLLQKKSVGERGGRSPLPEREVSSHLPLPQGGPEARITNYDWMSGEITQELLNRSTASAVML